MTTQKEQGDAPYCWSMEMLSTSLQEIPPFNVSWIWIME